MSVDRRPALRVRPRLASPAPRRALPLLRRTSPVRRRGVAMLAALWMVVMIATVAMQFSLAARERRALGLNASDRARDRAALQGALAVSIARLEYDLRTRTTNSAAASLRSTDPWIDADSIYSGEVELGGVAVNVEVDDLGATRNVNQMSEVELRTLFSFVLGDYTRADALAQSIMDWRDIDDLARVAGGEQAEYLRDSRLVLPSNAPFRRVHDLVHVAGMTANDLERVSPYLSAFAFTARVNVNTAPEAVLRSLPGMTDVVIANILSMRSAGRRIESLNAISVAVERSTRGRGRGRGGDDGGNSGGSQAERQLAAAATVDTRDLQLVLTVRDSLTAQPAKLVAVLQRANNNRVNIRWQEW